MSKVLITIQIHTMITDIVSVIKHTDCKAALVSATFQLKLLGKSTRCCRTLPGFGDYSMWCDLMEQYALKKTKISNKQVKEITGGS